MKLKADSPSRAFNSFAAVVRFMTPKIPHRAIVSDRGKANFQFMRTTLGALTTPSLLSGSIGAFYAKGGAI